MPQSKRTAEAVHEYTGARLAANVAIGAVAAGGAATAATGALLPAMAFGIVGAVWTYLTMSEIPKIRRIPEHEPPR